MIPVLLSLRPRLPPPSPVCLRNATLQQAFTHHGDVLGQHERTIRNLLEQNQSLAQQVSQLSNQVTTLLTHLSPAAAAAGPAAPLYPPESRSTDPEPFAGQPDLCRGFLFQCRSVFQQRPARFPTDASKTRYVCGLLRGRALQWAEARFSNSALDTTDFEAFINEFKLVFSHPHYRADAASRLLDITQGSRTVADYTVEFWTLAAEVDWSDSALKAVFSKGLRDSLKDELASRDEPSDLKALVTLANRVDNRLQERRRQARHSPVRSTARFPSPTAEEPMQIGRARLTAEERIRRRAAGECFYCGRRGHFVAACPARPKERAQQ
uniref:CCHC-type domain-containing protein n=1 Tax=Periophthalmus magnuspinnatus TaxID=409849 RepID=A0A3B3ZLD0_9GOBI